MARPPCACSAPPPFHTHALAVRHAHTSGHTWMGWKPHWQVAWPWPGVCGEEANLAPLGRDKWWDCVEISRSLTVGCHLQRRNQTVCDSYYSRSRSGRTGLQRGAGQGCHPSLLLAAGKRIITAGWAVLARRCQTAAPVAAALGWQRARSPGGPGSSCSRGAGPAARNAAEGSRAIKVMATALAAAA